MTAIFVNSQTRVGGVMITVIWETMKEGGNEKCAELPKRLDLELTLVLIRPHDSKSDKAWTS